MTTNEKKSNRIVDPHLMATVHAPGALDEQRFHRVLMRFNREHLMQIWSKLSSRAPTRVTEDSSEAHALHGVILGDVVDVITSHHEHVKQAFRESLVKHGRSAAAALTGQVSEQSIVQAHAEHVGKYVVPETNKLNLVNVIATDLDNHTAKSLSKIFHENPDLAEKIGLEYLEISREFRATDTAAEPPKTTSSSPSSLSPTDEPAAQIGVDPDVWAYDSKGFDGSGVVVAVVDSGADLSHDDLQGKCIAARDFTRKGAGSGRTLAADDVSDSTGHGTHVASTILGNGAASGSDRKYKGIAYNSKLMVAKVLGFGGTGTTEQIVKGIEWAVNNGADVINLSLGTPTPTDGSDSLSKAVERAVNDFGIVVCCAAGNDGREYDEETDVPTGKRAKRTIGSPGCTPSAITVGAVDKFNNVADFSSIGPVGVSPIPTDPKNIKPDVVAPGVDIVAAKASSFEYDGPSYGTKPDLPADLRKKYTFKSGTSMATPMVSGACALLIQAFRQANNLTDDSSWKAARNQPVGQYKNVPELVKHALMDTASKLRREEEYEIVPNASVVFGSGLVQINKSLERVLRSKAVLLPADQGETAAGRDLPYAVEDAQYPGHHDLRQVQEALRQLVDRQELTAKDANKIVTALQKISSDQVPALLHMIDWHVASGSITTNQLQQMAARKDPVIDVVIPLIKACSAGGGDIDISSVLTPVRTYLRSLGLPCAIGNCYAQTPSSSATGQMLTTSGLSVSSKQRARKVSTRLQ